MSTPSQRLGAAAAPPPAAPSWFLLTGHHLAAKLFARSGLVRRKAVNVGEIAGYVAWLRDTFGSARPLKHRESLWERMAAELDGADAVHGVEFGVAWGYASAWWLRRLPSPALRWDGFDRFTGLPRAWRGYESGQFDAGGSTPAIDDARVSWHVGDVEDRLGDLSLDRRDGERLVVLFDLDIYEPSLAAWNHVRPSLQRGDLLYFDEAFDADERRLLVQHVLPSGRFTVIGSTPMALALRVESPDER